MVGPLTRTWKLTAVTSAGYGSTRCSNFNSMFFFLSSTTSNPENRRQSLATLSFDPTTSCSLSSSSSISPIPAYSPHKKYVPNARSNDGCLTDVHDDDKVEKEPTPKNVEIEEKLVVRKQPLWQKLLLTSKKIRSIVLLNFITIVYGTSLLSDWFINNMI